MNCMLMLRKTGFCNNVLRSLKAETANNAEVFIAYY